ncbi:hypothetical protein DFH11DRAFT_1546715 [Phellopilus nigrolimitatus]|nr:hypothetical protein DFH11DRAFT_1546715 [Phellopilus nigrolimitatus]
MLPFYSRSVVWPAEKKQSTFESRSKTEVVRVARVRDVGNNRPSSCRSECTHFVFSSRSCAPCTVLSSSRRPLRTATQAAKTTAARVRPAAATATPEYAPPPLQQQQQQLPLPSSMLAQRRGAEHPPALSAATARERGRRLLNCGRAHSRSASARLPALPSHGLQQQQQQHWQPPPQQQQQQLPPPSSMLAQRRGAALHARSLSPPLPRASAAVTSLSAHARALNLRPLDHRLRSHPAVSSHGGKRMRARGNSTHAGLPYVVLEFDKNGILVDGLERETKRTAEDGGGGGGGVLKLRDASVSRTRRAACSTRVRSTTGAAVSHPRRLPSRRPPSNPHARGTSRPTRHWRPPYVALEFDKNEFRERRRRSVQARMRARVKSTHAELTAAVRRVALEFDKNEIREGRRRSVQDNVEKIDTNQHPSKIEKRFKSVFARTRAGMHSQYKK